MTIPVLLLCGPPKAGKSTLIRLLRRDVLAAPVGVIRVSDAAVADDAARDADVEYRLSLAPETPGNTLTSVIESLRKDAGRGAIVIEGDSEQPVRYAYPYTGRLFVMASGARPEDVFQAPEAAAAALRQIMADTAAFSSGLRETLGSDAMEEEEGVRLTRRRTADGLCEDLEVSDAQVQRFLASPLGADVAARVQLQPAYQAVIDSDVVVVNRFAGANVEGNRTVDHLSRLLARTRRGALGASVVSLDLLQPGGAVLRDLRARLRAVLSR